MDRQLVYPGQVPLSEQVLQAEKNKMIGLAFMAQAVLGTNTIVDGLVATPMTPATLSIQIGAGQVYQLANVDGSAYGTLPVDIIHSIVKQGVNQDVTTFTLTPPSTAGYAVNFLVQAALAETDTGAITLPYFNSANPNIPFTGPNNSGTAQPTARSCSVNLSVKGGVAATSGTQTTPAPDPGFVGLWVVTVAYGATTITSSNITVYPSAPFLNLKLPSVPAWVQAGAYSWGVDTGTANAMVAALNPVPAALTAGLRAYIKKSASANTGAVTLNVNGLGAVAVKDPTGASLASGTLTSGFMLEVLYDGSAWVCLNAPVTTTTVSSLTAVSGEGVQVKVDNTVNLNYPALTADTPTALDLFAFYDNEASHHRSIGWSGLVGMMGAALTTGLIGMQVLSSSGTYTKTTGAKRALVFGTGAGGAGGGGPFGFRAGGGGAGATVIALIDLTATSSVSFSIGAGGAGGTNSAGADGGDTTFGSYFTAGGGKGGGYGRQSGSLMTQGNGGGGGAPTAGAGATAIFPLGGSAGQCGGYFDPGAGAASFWGGAGKPGSKFLNAPPGGVGTAPGAGGGGGDGIGGAATGGAGANGAILVFEFA